HIGGMTAVGNSCPIPQHSMDEMADVKSAAWCTTTYATQDSTYATQDSTYVSEQERMQAHMTYPSYFGENQHWLTGNQHMTIPPGYPSSIAEPQPGMLEPTAQHNLIQPKTEPYESPLQASRHTINLDSLDGPSRAALFNSL